MVKIDNYASVGFALELLARSPYHSSKKLGNYFRTEVFPAIWTSQVQFYLNKNGIPGAMVTWAWITEEIENDIHLTGRALSDEEWQSGDRLFINDWISPYGNLRYYVGDMMNNVFPDVQFASSLRRNKDGTVRRINRWNRSSELNTREKVAS